MLFEQNTDAILTVNQDGRVIQANATFYRLSQLKCEEVVMKDYRIFFRYEHDDDELTLYDQRVWFMYKEQQSIPILVRKVTAEDHFFVIFKEMCALDAAYVQKLLKVWSQLMKVASFEQQKVLLQLIIKEIVVNDTKKIDRIKLNISEELQKEVLSDIDLDKASFISLII